MFAFNSMSTRSFECITDTHPVRSIALHPSGDFVLAGCTHPVVRLYQTEQPQAPALVAVAQHHSAAVNHVSWSSSGQTYASASRDGSVKLWDAVSSRVARTLAGAHGGAEVFSAVLSRCGLFLLSAGADGSARLVDTRTGGLLRVYKGLCATGDRVVASFAGLNEELRTYWGRLFFLFAADNQADTYWLGARMRTCSFSTPPQIRRRPFIGIRSSLRMTWLPAACLIRAQEIWPL